MADGTARAGKSRVGIQDMREATGIIGTGILAYGLWLAWPPLGFIFGGLFLVALSVLGTLRGNR